ncbi:translation initiation factor IF-2-like [Equus quagga]|uniref:translation initiation factor IF-2-like n=1 Tax=Equus quagga TaxID=89248 RepID=UPI001EE34E9E|nr:translation initiation factor IF-2-like [Equus quagga]
MERTKRLLLDSVPTSLHLTAEREGKRRISLFTKKARVLRITKLALQPHLRPQRFSSAAGPAEPHAPTPQAGRAVAPPGPPANGSARGTCGRPAGSAAGQRSGHRPSSTRPSSSLRGQSPQRPTRSSNGREPRAAGPAGRGQPSRAGPGRGPELAGVRAAARRGDAGGRAEAAARHGHRRAPRPPRAWTRPGKVPAGRGAGCAHVGAAAGTPRGRRRPGAAPACPGRARRRASPPLPAAGARASGNRFLLSRPRTQAVLPPKTFLSGRKEVAFKCCHLKITSSVSITNNWIHFFWILTIDMPLEFLRVLDKSMFQVAFVQSCLKINTAIRVGFSFTSFHLERALPHVPTVDPHKLPSRRRLSHTWKKHKVEGG